jgi:putative DNA-invertase from lambdoid prophage Rac
MLGQIRRDETLVVSKLDRHGRDAQDITATIRMLAKGGIAVVVLQLGNLDLVSPAGKLMLSMLAAVAELERDLLVERTQDGLARARSEGKPLRNGLITPEQHASAQFYAASLAKHETDCLHVKQCARKSRPYRVVKQSLSSPSKTNPVQRADIVQKYAMGESVSSLARTYSISRANTLGIVRALDIECNSYAQRDHIRLSMTCTKKLARQQ